jgi:hypothetical protein
LLGPIAVREPKASPTQHKDYVTTGTDILVADTFFPPRLRGPRKADLNSLTAARA